MKKTWFMIAGLILAGAAGVQAELTIVDSGIAQCPAYSSLAGSSCHYYYVSSPYFLPCTAAKFPDCRLITGNVVTPKSGVIPRNTTVAVSCAGGSIQENIVQPFAPTITTVYPLAGCPAPVADNECLYTEPTEASIAAYCGETCPAGQYAPLECHGASTDAGCSWAPFTKNGQPTEPYCSGCGVCQ